MTNQKYQKELRHDIKKIEFSLQHPQYMHLKMDNRLKTIKFLRKLNKLCPFFLAAVISFSSQYALKVTPFLIDERLEFTLDDEISNEKESANENAFWTCFYLFHVVSLGGVLNFFYKTYYGDAILENLNNELSCTLEFQKDYYELLKSLLEIKKNDLQLLQNDEEKERRKL